MSESPTPQFPITRDKMRRLKKETDEINRLYLIDQLVSEISKRALAFAKVNSTTIYTFHIDKYYSSEFCTQNIHDIIFCLEENFLACSIKYHPAEKTFTIEWTWI